MAVLPSTENGGQGMVRAASWTVYDKANHRTISASGYSWWDPAAAAWKYTLVNPVSIVKTNHDGDVTEQIQATAETTSLGTSSPLASLAAETFSQNEYTSWTTYQYAHKQLISTRAYHAIPDAAGTNVDYGDPGVNYDQTDYGYDLLGRPEWTKTADGTIAWNVLDVRGLVVSTWVGTNAAGATHADPSNGGTNNMALVSANIYDSGNDQGDGRYCQ